MPNVGPLEIAVVLLIVLVVFGPKRLPELGIAHERINRTIAEETGQPLSKVKVDTDRNYWMSAEEAKAYGLVTRIIERVDSV